MLLLCRDSKVPLCFAPSFVLIDSLGRKASQQSCSNFNMVALPSAGEWRGYTQTSVYWRPSGSHVFASSFSVFVSMCESCLPCPSALSCPSAQFLSALRNDPHLQWLGNQTHLAAISSSLWSSTSVVHGLNFYFIVFSVCAAYCQPVFFFLVRTKVRKQILCWVFFVFLKNNKK